MATHDTPLSLLDRLRSAPDEPSWQRLAELYAPLVRRWLGQQGLAESDAEDVSQEILLVLVREVPSFDHNGRRGAFRAWVRGITLHRLRSFWRSRRTGPAQAGDE